MPCFQRLFPAVILSCLVALRLRFKIETRHTNHQLAAWTALRHGCVGDTKGESKRWCVHILKEISLMFYFPKLLIINVSFWFLGMTNCLFVTQCDLDSPSAHLESLHSKWFFTLLSPHI